MDKEKEEEECCIFGRGRRNRQAAETQSIEALRAKTTYSRIPSIISNSNALTSYTIMPQKYRKKETQLGKIEILRNLKEDLEANRVNKPNPLVGCRAHHPLSRLRRHLKNICPSTSVQITNFYTDHYEMALLFQPSHHQVVL